MYSKATQETRRSRRRENSSTTNDFFVETFEEEEVTCAESVQYWWFNCLVSGIFATPRIIGYTQFMVFMILRVIIAGSLCGRIFGNDPYTTNCSLTLDKLTMIPRQSISNVEHAVKSDNDSIIDPSSYEVKEKCLFSAYSNVSPITVWALSLLTVVLPWLVLLPWTPTKDEQDYATCKPTKLQWPCLTIYAVRFMKACIRLVLEFVCAISVPILYGWRIPPRLVCYDGHVTCDLPTVANEKTYFLWFFVVLNLMSFCLSTMEIADICRNKHVYETERVGYSSSSRLSSNRSSTAAMLALSQRKDGVENEHRKTTQDDNLLTIENDEKALETVPVRAEKPDEKLRPHILLPTDCDKARTFPSKSDDGDEMQA